MRPVKEKTVILQFDPWTKSHETKVLAWDPVAVLNDINDLNLLIENWASKFRKEAVWTEVNEFRIGDVLFKVTHVYEWGS
jgi:hypothetical protein